MFYLGGALLWAVGAGLMINSMGVLSNAGGGPVQLDSDMSSSHAFNISNINSSYLKCSTLALTDYSNLTGWQNKIDNISSTNKTCNSACNSALYVLLYDGTLCYNTLVPSGAYVANNISNVNICCINLSYTGLLYIRV